MTNDGLTIQEYSHKNITFEHALDFARIQQDAFKDDNILKAFSPEYAQFSKAKLPPIADFEKLRERVDTFERLTYGLARHIHYDVASSPRHRLFIMKDGAGKLVAGSHWVLPQYVDFPRYSIFTKIKLLFMKIWYRIKDVLAFALNPNPFADGKFFGELNWGKSEVGCLLTKEKEQELQNANPKELSKVSYPKALAYYLHILCVRSDAHGRGLGRTMINSTLEALAPYESPKGIYGPPKATLMAAPNARGFYYKDNWNLGATVEHPLFNGEPSVHTYLFKNLKPKAE